ncbi:MAG TPA: hypothetical protein PLU30_05690 [Verrucomicrobiae bacterium]|nr:hypothetical protein [Verrucomicrobiae bacterium]
MHRFSIYHLWAVSIIGAAMPGFAQSQSTPGNDSPIHVTFVIHFDPLPAPQGRVPRWAYEAERDNLAWLSDYLDRLEKEKGIEFVPRLTLEMAGDHAEWYLEDETGLELLRRLHRKGIHCFGTHFHRNLRRGNHLWIDTASPESSRQVTQDHISMVDRLIAKVIGSTDPKVIRAANRIITGHFVDLELAAKEGFDTLTGGRNEAMNLFFDHDVYNPWRPADEWPLAEDLQSRWILVPQAPVLGQIGEHAPLPEGVSEAYTAGMHQIWQDLSVPAMRRKFLHLYLECQSSRAPRIWVFGWHEHTSDIFPDDAPHRQRKFRGAVTEFVGWLNANFIGTSDSGHGPVARYSTTEEVREAFLSWEKAYPRRSSFNYDARTPDWEKFPYHLKGLAWALICSHHDRQIDHFKAQGVHVHKLSKTPARNWELRDGAVTATAPVSDIYLLWSDRGDAVIDFSGTIPGRAERMAGAGGARTVVETGKLVIGNEPIILRSTAPTPPAQADKGPRMPIQFRMNVNWFPGDDAARENCRLLRRHLELFKQSGVKASYWFTGLGAEQIQRLDPEFLRLLNDGGMPVVHHGANRPPRPQPIDRVRGESWDEDVQAIMDYESCAIDPGTGHLDKAQTGGLKMMQQMFGGRITATGRFFEASILYVTKQFGCRAMIGLKGNTGASTEAGWFLGMKGMPDAISIAPGLIRQAAAGQADLFRVIEESLAQHRTGGVQSIAVLVHDHDFLDGSTSIRERGSPAGSADLQHRFWETYEKLVNWAAAHPRLKVVTFEEILDQISDDRVKTVTRDALLQAAAVVVASPAAPPEYIDVGGDYLSLADAFQAFAFALAHFAQHGELPHHVEARDILGPTHYRAEERPERGTLEFAQGEDHLRVRGAPPIDPRSVPTTPKPQSAQIETPGPKVISAAKVLDLSREIPSDVIVDEMDVNPAVFLQLMAQTIQNIHATRECGTARIHGDVNVLPRQVQQNVLADALTKLQFWTFKPERWNGPNSGSQTTRPTPAH